MFHRIKTKLEQTVLNGWQLDKKGEREIIT